MFASIQYYYTYIIGSTSDMSLAMSLMTIIPIPVMLLGGVLNSKGIGKGRLILSGAIVDVLGLTLLIFTRSALTANLAIGLFAVGIRFRNSMMFAALPDIFDYTEYYAKKTLAGTQTAVIAFIGKLASALASGLISMLLVKGNYNADILDKLLASGGTVQDIAAKYPETVFAIKFAFIGVLLITTVLCIISLLPYNLDKKNAEIRAELDRRKEQMATE